MTHGHLLRVSERWFRLLVRLYPQISAMRWASVSWRRTGTRQASP